MTDERVVIFNADDFGASTGINRGIIDCHLRGPVTSTSAMVTGRAIKEAVALSRQHPSLSIGLHFDLWGEGEREFDLADEQGIRSEFRIQLDQFCQLFGRMPTHVDTHRHAHRRPGMMPLFKELVAPLGVPLRDNGQIKFVGTFYAQWEWMVTDLQHVSVEALLDIIESDAQPGWTEFACHPGYCSDDFTSIYFTEREAELATLTNPAVVNFIHAKKLRLASFRHYEQ